MKINESGRSMIEMLGVLAIIGVLSVGGIAGYSKAMGKHRVNKSIEQITQIVSSVRSLFYGHKTYAALDDSTADLVNKAHLFPDELGNGTGTNPFSGNVTIKSAKKNASDSKNKAFTITYTLIPEEACIDLVTQDWGKGARSGFVRLKVGSKTFTSSPISIADATNSSACNGQSNTIEFTFY
ncbi:MAG: hypothetical protein IJ677_03380 [Alphaproteobacteria bacterium]|nr:hypothetical protein [Alphaproteobacteria bacterium]